MPKSLFPDASPETRARLEQDPALLLFSEYDWSAHALGSICTWSESLRGAVRAMMTAPVPMVMMIGQRGTLIYNSHYARFAEGRHPDIFGMSVFDAWPEAAAFNAVQLAKGLAGLSTSIPQQEFLLNRNGTPEPIWMEQHYSPVLDADGLPLGTLGIVLDITGRIIAEQALARSEERLSLAINGTSLVGTWDWDIVNDSVTADERFATLYNLDPQRAGLGLPISEFLHAVHPDDARRVRDEIAAALRTSEAFESEYRLVAGDGSIIWVVASGRPRLDAAGKPYRFPGVTFDVTEQHRVAEALAESDLQFRTLADAMPQMVWSTRPDGYHDYYNARWYELTGMPEDAVKGDGWSYLIHEDDRTRTWNTWRNSLRTGEPYQVEYRLRHHTGEFRWTLARALPMHDAGGQVGRWIGTCTDIHESRLAADERELVAQELSHRIKNIFAVLTGIVSLSARNSPEIKPFADQLRERIFALGEAHDFVRPHSHASSGASGQGTLSSLIMRLMLPYNNDAGDRIRFVGDDALIDEAAATPLALLFHELATNAAKYGALRNEAGAVTITARATGERYHLNWHETGGPVTAEPIALSGFGSRLIQLSVEGQMRGELHRRWKPEGLEVDISLPVDALRRSERSPAGGSS